MRRNNFRMVVLMPILLALAVVLGMFIGKQLNTKAVGGPTRSLFSSVNKPADKINELLELITNDYVDTINQQKLTDDAIAAILEQLDPHSSYIPPVQLQAFNDELEGNFEGIGIEFNILKDTIVVVSAISGGPSEAVGIRAGDRIVKIGEELMAGKNITNDDVIKRLRGKKGTKVKVMISRSGSSTLTAYTITRAKIPLYSLETAYMINSSTGYIKINRFAETTYDEYMTASDKLRERGMKKMILDLRGNPGGFLNAATDLADEFLSNRKLIVYTEGKARKKRYYYATGSGKFEEQPLVVLVDEGSASASEIVAGAIQDNDRGMIIGRRSFGKGLVQEQIEFNDGSAIRLTVARYYTATGRCIQRSYDHGIEEYYAEMYEDFDPAAADTLLKKDTLQKFVTKGGKIVYGGGGIMPDIYMAYDTTGYTKYLSDVVNKGISYDFSFDYADRNRKAFLSKYSNYILFAKDRNQEQQLLESFVTYAAAKGIPRNDEQISISRKVLVSRVKALVARNVWGSEAFYYIINDDDATMKKAIEVLARQ